MHRGGTSACGMDVTHSRKAHCILPCLNRRMGNARDEDRRGIIIELAGFKRIYLYHQPRSYAMSSATSRIAQQACRGKRVRQTLPLSAESERKSLGSNFARTLGIEESSTQLSRPCLSNFQNPAGGDAPTTSSCTRGDRPRPVTCL